jgi:hypothetical protein
LLTSEIGLSLSNNAELSIELVEGGVDDERAHVDSRVVLSRSSGQR